MRGTSVNGLLAVCFPALLLASIGASARPFSVSVTLRGGTSCSVDTATGDTLTVPLGKFEHPDYNADCECERRGFRTKWSCKYCTVESENGGNANGTAPAVFTTKPGRFVHPDHGGSCNCNARTAFFSRYTCDVCKIKASNGTKVTVPNGSFNHPDDGGQCECKSDGRTAQVDCDYCTVPTRTAGVITPPPGTFKHPDYPGECKCEKIGRWTRTWTCSYCSVGTKANGTIFVGPGPFLHPDHAGDCTCESKGRVRKVTCKSCTIPAKAGDLVVAPGPFRHPDSGRPCMCSDHGTWTSWGYEDEDEDEEQQHDGDGEERFVMSHSDTEDAATGTGISHGADFLEPLPSEGLLNITVDLPDSLGGGAEIVQPVPASGSVSVNITIPTGDTPGFKPIGN